MRVLVIGLFVALSSMLAATGFAQNCRWDGTAPFCDGACHGGETELTRASDLPPHWKDAYPGIQNTNFGAGCVTGSKALCCPAQAGECRWDGTAPFCSGGCGPGEVAGTPPPGSSSGQSCATGHKAYCCRSRTGTSRAALQTNRALVSYAAFWDKSSGPPGAARHGLSAQQYQQTFDDLLKKGYRPVVVRGYSVDGQPTYAAIFEQRQGTAFVARHDLSAAGFQSEFDRWTREGYRPVDIAGYTVGTSDHYTAIFEKLAGPAFRVVHGLTSAAYQNAFNQALADGFRPVRVSGYTVNGQDRYAAIFEKRTGPALVARHSMTSAQYQQEFNNWGGKGYRLVDLSSWKSGDEGRYAAIWEKTAGPAWQARHSMIGDSYQETFNEMAKAGYRLREVTGFHLYQ